jgi:hypothetical protein
MSSDDHGHGSDHGHDDGPSDIIAVGSWQDKMLALVCVIALVFLGIWGNNFLAIAAAHTADKPPAEEGHEHAAE